MEQCHSLGCNDCSVNYLHKTKKHKFSVHLCRMEDRYAILKFSVLTGQLIDSHFTSLKSLWKARSLFCQNECIVCVFSSSYILFVVCGSRKK